MWFFATHSPVTIGVLMPFQQKGLANLGDKNEI